jgi:hypothetical protein
VPGDFGIGSCDARTPLSDEEIAGIFRAAADENGLVGPVELLVIDGRCVVAGDHEEHADDLAVDKRRTERLWLRWDPGGQRVLEWLAGCLTHGECVLFAGHAGKCQWEFGEEDMTGEGEGNPNARWYSAPR